MRPLGLKPPLTLEALRGAEAPLFHGATRIREFFRNLWKLVPFLVAIRVLPPGSRSQKKAELISQGSESQLLSGRAGLGQPRRLRYAGCAEA
jgi:hypothetical protein